MATSDISKSPLYIDSTNGRVSIGTSSAESLPLTVAGSQSAIALVDTDRVDNTYYSAVWGDQVANLHLVADYQGTFGSSFISMRVGGTALANEKVRVTSAGNVGIGTASPQELLHLSLPSGTNGDIVRLSRSAGAYSFQLGVSSGSTSNLYISDNSNNNIIDFTSTGNVGIGNSNPQHKFHITHSGTGAIPTDYQMGATSPNDNYQGIHNNNNSATFSGLALETRTSGASRWLIANEWKNTYLGDLVFRNRNGGVTSQESMRIDSSGRVTMPYQPAFRAYNNPVTAGSGTQLVWQNAATNVGGHYSTSTGRFTAPITGTYMFTVSVMYPTSGTNYVRILFGVNGTNSTDYMDTLEGAESNYTVANGSTIIGLSAGDYVATYNSSPYSTYGLGYGSFCGFLIG